MWSLRLFNTSILLAVLACSCSAAVIDDAFIYRGTDPASEGITLGGWGSGKASATKKKALETTHSVEITCQSFYSGGRFDFAQPIPIITSGTDLTNKYILFTMFFNDTDIINPAGQNYEFYEVIPYFMPRVSKLRFIFVSDTGKQVSDIESTNPLDPDDRWVRVAVPLSKLRLPADMKSFNLKRIVICAQAPVTITVTGGNTATGGAGGLAGGGMGGAAGQRQTTGSGNTQRVQTTVSVTPVTFNVGVVKLVTDSAPIKVDSMTSQYIAINDPVFLQPDIDAGVSSLRYTWDWNDGTTIEPNSTNKIGAHQYTRGGDFNVSLTVTDADGIKAPVTTVTKISVSD